MNEDYTQPFYVGVNNTRFRGISSSGYLPALEPKEIDEPEPVVKPKSIYFKMDRGAFELNRRVKELENAYQYLIRKEKKEKDASKDYEPF